jgi:S1-C subfamily serine protease
MPGTFGTDLGEEPELPDEFKVYPAFPNPFNPSTRLVFEIPGPSRVNVDVFSVDGRLVRRIFNQDRPQGMHTAVFDASGLGSGVYFARISTAYGVKSVKMTLVK